MPKSTPSPTKSTAKATEIRLNVPNTRRPNAAVARKATGGAGSDGLEAIGEPHQRLRERVESRRVALYSFEDERQRVHQAAHARIRGKRAEQGLRGDQPLCRLRDLLRRFEQETHTIEERSTV